VGRHAASHARGGARRRPLFLCGGGILAHPGGPAAGVASVRQAWEATRAGRSLADAARDAPELRDALAFFGR
jgi:ribulose-bisphosphate carboxylase large chain